MSPKSQSPMMGFFWPLWHSMWNSQHVHSLTELLWQRPASFLGNTVSSNTYLLEGKSHTASLLAWHSGHEQFGILWNKYCLWLLLKEREQGAQRRVGKIPLFLFIPGVLQRPSWLRTVACLSCPPFLLRFKTICVLSHFHMQNVFQHFSLDF